MQELRKRPSQGQQQGDGSAGQRPQAVGGSPASTNAEKQQALGQELQQGFTEFDRLILSEQQANNERADQEQASDLSGSDELLADSASAQGPAGEPLQTALADTDPPSIEGDDISARSQSPVPPDLADASGDDIIARQLREAAMKEQDPELRKKLWDEYRKYKRDLR